MAERVMGKIKKENKNKMVNSICPIFRFATKTFNGGYKSKMSILIQDESYMCEI